MFAQVLQNDTRIPITHVVTIRYLWYDIALIKTKTAIHVCIQFIFTDFRGNNLLDKRPTQQFSDYYIFHILANVAKFPITCVKYIRIGDSLQIAHYLSIESSLYYYNSILFFFSLFQWFCTCVAWIGIQTGCDNPNWGYAWRQMQFWNGMRMDMEQNNTRYISRCHRWQFIRIEFDRHDARTGSGRKGWRKW